MVSRRLYWACCHTMLRLSEIPLFLEHGIEIIPTEVTPGVLNELEGLTYDSEDPTQSAWRQAATLPDQILTRLRRARLWERNGLLSDAEEELFNSTIDAIYVPTRLRVAINVLSWFRGTVLFRYFGDLDEAWDDDRLVAEIPPGHRDRLIILPIFRTLSEKATFNSFHRVVLHNFIDQRTVPGAWNPNDGAPAVIVLGNLHYHEPSQSLIRDLIPLAKRIPIKLLGKNVASQLPQDIKDAFDVKTDLSRRAFFDELLSSRLLIYPHARRHHSHNVPIEAIYAGMPIVFRTDTPSFLESDHPSEVMKDPSLIGAARSGDDLLTLAFQVYSDPAFQKQLQAAQKRLIDVYSHPAVSAEAVRLLEIIPLSRSDDTVASEAHPVSSLPASAYYSARGRIVRDDSTCWLAELFADETLGRLDRAGTSDGCYTTLNETFLQAIVGPAFSAEPVYFDAAVDHEVSLNLRSIGDVEFEVVFELFHEDRIIKRDVVTIPVSDEGWSDHSATFRFSGLPPVQLALYAKSSGTGRGHAGTLAHKILPGSPRTSLWRRLLAPLRTVS